MDVRVIDGETVHSAREVHHPAADAQLSAREFIEESTKDRAAFMERYAGKVLEISGVIFHALDHDTFGPYLYLGYEGLDKADVFKRIELMLPLSDKARFDRLAVGQAVKIRARAVSEGGARVALAWAELTAVGPSPALSITADELLKEFSADREKAGQKYRDKAVFVKGTVKGTLMPPAPGGFGGHSLRLEGGRPARESPRLIARLGGSEFLPEGRYFKKLRRIQSGQEIELRGVSPYFSAAEDAVILEGYVVSVVDSKR